MVSIPDRVTIVLVASQQADDFGGVFVGHLLDVVNVTAGQRAGEHDDTDAGHAEGGGPCVSCSGEAAGDYADRGNTPGLGYDRVVETPRSAGASISDGVDDGVALQKQILQLLVGVSGAVGGLTVVDDLLDAVVVQQGLL